MSAFLDKKVGEDKKYLICIDRKTGEIKDTHDVDQFCGGGPDTCGGCGWCLSAQFPANDEFEWREVNSLELIAMVRAS